MVKKRFVFRLSCSFKFSDHAALLTGEVHLGAFILSGGAAGLSHPTARLLVVERPPGSAQGGEFS